MLRQARFSSTPQVKFCLGLNIALLAAVATLLRIDSESWLPLALVSFVGILALSLGTSTIDEGHRYYQRTVWKKTFIEELMGLSESIRTHQGQPGTLAIATTKSQEDTNYILNDRDAWLARTDGQGACRQYCRRNAGQGHQQGHRQGRG